MIKELITPISYAFASVVVLVVIGIFLLKLDTNTQTYCDDALVEFVDNARTSGYISASSYLEFVNSLNNTNNLYSIKIMHKSETLVPYMDASGNVVNGKLGDAYNAYYEDEILAVLFPENSNGYGTYALKKGDYLKVTYSLKEPTMGARFIGYITKHAPKTVQGSYGGYVGSTEENGIG